MIERLSLNALKFFYFVATYGSVTVAAKKLFVTQSAVSKQIYNLEATLQLTLFHRKNKTLTLSLEGKILLKCCESIFQQLDDCLMGLTKHKIQNKQLVLSCESTLSMKWLIPRLSKFKALGHDFEVVLLTGGGAVDFEKQEIDLAIRRNDFAWGEQIYSEKIADEYMVMIQAAINTNNETLLISNSRPHFLQTMKKNDEFNVILKPLKIVELEHFYLCLEGCLAGLGATISSMYMIEKELKYQIFQKKSAVIQDASAYYLLSHTAFEADQRKLIFLQWLKQEMRESMALFHEK